MLSCLIMFISVEDFQWWFALCGSFPPTLRAAIQANPPDEVLYTVYGPV